MSATLPRLGDPPMVFNFHPALMDFQEPGSSCQPEKSALHYFNHYLRSSTRLPPQITDPRRCRFRVVASQPSHRQLREPDKYLLSTWTQPSGKIYYLYCYQT